MEKINNCQCENTLYNKYQMCYKCHKIKYFLKIVENENDDDDFIFIECEPFEFPDPEGLDYGLN
jgi:hypothetical protein